MGKKVIDTVGKQVVSGDTTTLKLTPTQTTVSGYDSVRVGSLHVCVAAIPVGNASDSAARLSMTDQRVVQPM